ncbi:DUF4349 domain-containing protein [Oscillospiraceae bacterium HV4-5-C5C]|nr:DUF4349 domain-containing protein [Oscillospiraceae bacterium HV4-5-C5C]
MKKRPHFNNARPALLQSAGLVCLLLLSAGLYACSGSSAARSDNSAYQTADGSTLLENATMDAASANDTAGNSGAPATDPDQAKRIITQNLDLETAQVGQAVDGLAAAALQLQGYVSNRSLYESDGSYYGSITVRLPAGQEELFATTAAEFGAIRRQDSSIEDISDTYYDARARLDNARVQEARLLEMYAQAENVDDMVAIQLQLDAVQERIEVLEGSLRLWDNQVAYSTVNVNVYTDSDLISSGSDVPRFVDRGKVWERLQSGIRTSAVRLVNQSANLLIWLAAHLLQLLLLALFLTVLILLLRRHKVRFPGRSETRAANLSAPQDPAGQAAADKGEGARASQVAAAGETAAASLKPEAEPEPAPEAGAAEDKP